MERKEVIEIVQKGYTSEWGLAKFIPAMYREGMYGFFYLKAISGREKDKDRARDRLLEEIIKKAGALKEGKNWRFENTVAEIDSSNLLLGKLANNSLEYLNE